MKLDWQTQQKFWTITQNIDTQAQNSLPFDVVPGVADPNYRVLRDLLRAGKWFEADIETQNLMLRVSERTSIGWLTVEDLNNFPCAPLQTINQLWLDYSQEKFGLTVQAEIYRALGGTISYERSVWLKFTHQVGWRADDKWLNSRELPLTLFNTIPRGFLPMRVIKKGRAACSLLNRVRACLL